MDYHGPHLSQLIEGGPCAVVGATLGDGFLASVFTRAYGIVGDADKGLAHRSRSS